TGIKNDWTRELFDLTAWKGVANLRLRFQFTSGATSSFAFSEDDGFYIDNVKVIKSTSVLVTLPVHFISFTGTLLPDQTVHLDWVAITDQQHDYFEVEKSVPGNGFISLGRGPEAPPYWKIDPSPAPGNNFYRIKQFDKNGTITYSNIINVQYNPAFSVGIYPNPVNDILNIKISTAIADQYTIQLTDMSGRRVYEGKIVTGPAGKILTIDLRHEAAQVYVLVARNNMNEIISSQKVVKQQ
ncbi:MAG: T9SS type A sorting domain-containing protein, partial [Chitinophagaceae bacterium]